MLPPLHIVEGAKDDERCGIGIHAEDPDVLSECMALIDAVE